MGAERRAGVTGALVAMAALALPVAASAQTGPSPEGARRWRGHHRGLLLQGRMGQSFGGASTLGGLAGLGALGSLGSSSALGAAIGYRGGSWSLAFASYEASARSDDGVAFGLLLGLSARYWLSPAVAVGVEIGESYSSTPLLILSTSAAADSRTSAFATFGTINLSVVFGE